MTTLRRLLQCLSVAILSATALGFVLPEDVKRKPFILLASSKQDLSPQDALQRTAAHLQKLQKQQEPPQPSKEDPFAQERELLYREYIKQSANALKSELKQRGLMQTGRKPSLAARLAEYDLQKEYGIQIQADEDLEEIKAWKNIETKDDSPVTHFCGLRLSDAAASALGAANFQTPSPIQAQAIPALNKGESSILHAETGSGKTLGYLLPFTEMLWAHQYNDDSGYGVIMTPTRELAAQVAGIATVLAPPGTVRLISHATNLMSDGIKERGEGLYGGRMDSSSRAEPKLFIGSAKSIMHSLYGDGVMPASPTTKPEAQYFLKNVRYLVLDEVDRLLHVKKSRSESTKSKVHEKPAAIVTAAVTRLTLGRAQIVAASATVGRPLKRELARVLGLPAQSCPRVIHGEEENVSNNKRAVTVPPTVRNYVVAVDGSSTGKLLTSAAFVLKQLSNKPRKILLVLTRAFGMSTQNAVGALKHFGCRPEPISLLDALEASGTDDMIQVHQRVSGASGVGESNSYFSSKQNDSNKEMGYLLVTGEDTVRGLHLDGLDVVIVVGRPHGPDEYTHIAGRTGRAGQAGSVVNVVSMENAAALASWEHMLSLHFEKVEGDDTAKL